MIDPNQAKSKMISEYEKKYRWERASLIGHYIQGTVTPNIAQVPSFQCEIYLHSHVISYYHSISLFNFG